MKRKNLFLPIILFFLFTNSIRADEGMWIPLLLNKYNIEDMQKKGFKLSAEDIYSINQACMKDAVMIFGGGCTAELISDEGLIITNHHCGYGRIQSHSTLEHDYLTDGFWAMSRGEELPNPGLTVTFLVRMEDVTKRVLSVLTDNMTEIQRQVKVDSICRVIEQEAVDTTHYQANIEPFYYGNEYYLFVTEDYKDVRLVGAPPSSIGKFGGDTDNWMWPRHTGDFSLFRIYADKNNQPAEYAEENVPFKPKKHFSISLNGVERGDFTLVFGYPGSTEQYIPSYGVYEVQKVLNPHRINIREKKIDIMSVAMAEDPKVRIQYATKYARVSNYWKKWIGENRGLRRLDAIEKKQEQEKQFMEWVNKNEKRKDEYGNILTKYEELYEQLTPYRLAYQYFYEAGYSLDLIYFVAGFRPLWQLSEETPEEEVKETVENIRKSCRDFYKDYHQALDKELTEKILELYNDSMAVKFSPGLFQQIEKEYDGDFAAYTDYLYENSMFVDEDKMNTYLDDFTPDKINQLTSDPAYHLFASIVRNYSLSISPALNGFSVKMDSLNRIYMRGLREMSEEILYPDANFTLRVAYGEVDGYEPFDGAVYDYYTTLSGVIAKEDPDVYDYQVPVKLKELYHNRDFGPYGENGEMPVCFIATNHTSGGNSGSPVIDAEGNLIGVNFDRCWQGTMSDIMFDPERCRNITLDIRYALFIIDKFAGAGHLVDEMTIIE